MVELSDAQVIEVFHLQFLQVMTSRRSDWFVLKGGANLRYFFGSVRYSNDIDLDFWGVEGHRVQERVEKVLRGVALKMLLGLHEIEISDWSEPKQTETTRR